MARKKGTPQKAPEYKKKAPGKAKDGSTCYTRQGNGGSYVTCTGTQKSGSGKAVRSGPPPKGTKKGTAKRTGGAPGKKTAEKNARLDARKQVLKRGTAVRKKNIDDRFDRELAGLHDISDKLEEDKRKKKTTKAEFDRAVADLRAYSLTNPILKHHDDLSGTHI